MASTLLVQPLDIVDIACCGISRDTFRRQIGRIDHPADKAQIKRHQLLGIVHDEHTAHIELMRSGVTIPYRTIARAGM